MFFGAKNSLYSGHFARRTLFARQSFGFHFNLHIACTQTSQFLLAGTTKDKIDKLALYEPARAKKMPVEIFDVDKFIEIAERAEYCNIKRLEREVKLKLRTPKHLYTLKVNPTKAEEIIKKLRCEIREI